LSQLLINNVHSSPVNSGVMPLSVMLLTNAGSRLNGISISRIIFSMSEETTQNLPNSDLGRILARLDSIDARLNDVAQRLERLEARAYDTKPIWERALAEIIEIGKRLESLDRRFSILTDDVIHTRADVRRIEERISNLEQPPRA
jgi:chromosome segregation ATPase